MTRLIAVYGSLRQGFHNHERFGNMKHVGYSAIRGYMTLVYKSYPQLFLGESNTKDSHILELYEVDEAQFAQIDAMERGAGYSQHKLKTNGGEAIMWVIDDIRDMGGEYIKSYNHDVLK